MIKMSKLAVLAGFAVSVFASAGRAEFVVEFSYGSGTVVVNAMMGTATASGGASLAGALVNGYVSLDGGQTIHFIGGKTLVIQSLTVSDGNTGSFGVTASISTTNMPGTPTIAKISTQDVLVTNNTGGQNTLTVKTSDTGFTAPATNPLILGSSATVTYLGSQGAQFVFNSYLNLDNSQSGTSAGTPTITLNPTGQPGDQSVSGNTFAAVTGPLPNGTYSLVQIGQYTLAAGDQFVGGIASTSVYPTPAPSGLLLALTGVPILGIGAWLRRRRTVTADLESKV